MYAVIRTNGQVLMHHGILGQKWGVRRFQNPDGSYTSAGRERYGIGDSRSHGPQEKFGDRRRVQGLVRKTIPAGYTFYRIQRKDADTLGNANGGVYVYQPKDRKNLRSIAPWISQTQGISQNKLEEIEMRSNRPIKVASQKDVDEIYAKMAKDPAVRNKMMDLENDAAFLQVNISAERMEHISAEELSSEMKKVIRERMESRSFIKKIFENGKDKAKLETADAMAKMVVDTIQSTKEALDNLGETHVDSPELVNKIKMAKDQITRVSAYDVDMQKYVYDNLRKAGFDAMYDNNMIGAGLPRTQEAHEPLILLDNTSLTKVGSTDKLDVMDSYKSWDQYRTKTEASNSIHRINEIIDSYKKKGEEPPEIWEWFLENAKNSYNTAKP